MRKIPLTQGRVALVDDQDFELVSRYKWRAQFNRGTKSYYAKTSYLVESEDTWPDKKEKTLSIQNLIMRPPKGMVVDHKNHDTLDNRRENLRVCTLSQNAANRRRRFDTVSGYKGVFPIEYNGKWRAVVYCQGKQHIVGTFDSDIEAARAYDEKARELFGEYAYTNFNRQK